ncbi:hypothetical protein JO972_02315 [Verrucomicrobiaceae bacterium 5K15]|uniref:Uncharacterized protein n=1 Tax=Oceaniferula flava TaxID=2800421 RepID=A0AAE2SC54_9BACT|nr:hypothetical protein [Oceaniferula flavus]MBK1853780.1 hypothetical protein [Oceaniferula flavus]MBM1135087.1 hypothetical protein [Oceaniferula flavus]
MNDSHQLKKWLTPAGILLVILCGLYLGAGAISVNLDQEREAGTERSVQRNVFKSLLRSVDHLVRSSKKNPSEDALDDVESLEKSSPASRVQSYQAALDHLAKKQLKQDKTAKGAAKKKTSTAKLAKTFQLKPQDYLRGELLAEACQMAMRSEEPWRNLIQVSSEYSRNSDLDVARDLLLVAERLAVYPGDPERTSTAVAEVVKAMLSQRHEEDAYKALQNISIATARESAMSTVASWAARQGRLRTARNLASSITTTTVKDTVLVAMAESEAAYENYTRAMHTATRIESEDLSNNAYRRIALKRAAVLDFASAERAVSYINNNDIRDATLGSIAKQRARSGDLEGGLGIITGINDPMLADACLRILADELAKEGRFTTSYYVTTRISDELEKSMALEKLTVAQAGVGDLMGALVRADAIPMEGIRERALRSVSAVTAKLGAAGRARNVAVSICSNEERARAYRNIATAAAENGDHTSAFNTLQEIDEPDEKALALVELARTTQNQGDKRRALELLEGAGREAQQLTSSGDIDSIRANMAVAYAERSDSGKSMVLVRKIEDQTVRDETFRNLAKTLAVNHDVQSAQASVFSISSEPLRRSAADNVAKALAKSVKPEKALKYSRSLSTGRQRIVFLLEVARRI